MHRPYSVLGSCVTRDAADLGKDPLHRPVEYFSRTKIQSVVSAPTPIVDDIGLASAFQTRVVVEDHRKVPLERLSGIDHPLVVDLIDERFRLLQTPTGLVTESLYFRQSALATKDYGRLPEDEALDVGGPFWLAARQLAERLTGTPLVVHHALYATRDSVGDQMADAARSQKRNEWLRHAYRILADAFPDSQVVEVDADLVRADPAHRWGLGPFHYVDDYYDQFAIRVREALDRA